MIAANVRIAPMCISIPCLSFQSGVDMICDFGRVVRQLKEKNCNIFRLTDTHTNIHVHVHEYGSLYKPNLKI